MAPTGYRNISLTDRAFDDLNYMAGRLATALGRSVTRSTVSTVCAQLIDMTPDPVLRAAARQAFQPPTDTD